jgi:hypothetical protein
VPKLNKTTNSVVNLPDVQTWVQEQVTTVVLSAVELVGEGAGDFRQANAQKMAVAVADRTGIEVRRAAALGAAAAHAAGPPEPRPLLLPRRR